MKGIPLEDIYVSVAASRRLTKSGATCLSAASPCHRWVNQPELTPSHPTRRFPPTLCVFPTPAHPADKKTVHEIENKKTLQEKKARNLFRFSLELTKEFHRVKAFTIDK